tara:strand:- start:1960 stop:2544 length:585 start_codon:yes stop_codon:yes gene_type:complete
MKVVVYNKNEMNKSPQKQNQRIIIFDGPDMCGKTEMSLELSRRLEIPYFKNEGEWDFFENDPGYFANCVKYGATFLCSFLKQVGSSVIMDRGHHSEWVYSQIFQRATDQKLLKRVDNAFAEMGAVLIVPYRSTYHGLVDQFDAITPKKLQEIDEKYKKIKDWTACDVFYLNVDDENLDREMSDILKYLHTKEMF